MSVIWLHEKSLTLESHLLPIKVRFNDWIETFVCFAIRIRGGDFSGMWFRRPRSGIATPSTDEMIPTPSQLVARFERGEIEREEFQALMAVHARELIAEIEEDHRNPAAAWIESLLARQAAGRLVRRHGSRLLRELLAALAEVSDFPPARHLWNAAHSDVPLHCFLRIRRTPVFRILSIVQRHEIIELLVEYGESGKDRATRQVFHFRRDATWQLRLEMAT